MTELPTHPGRSPEFLSRLHDGEVSAAERAQFESHRAHCSSCREAATELESALALFRSSRPATARPDLSARILRRLRSSNRRPTRFGVTFGIDLRWAGAFVAALLAVLVGSSVVVRREFAERRKFAQSSPIPVIIGDRSTASPPSSSPKEVPPAAQPASASRGGPVPPPLDEKRADRAPERKADTVLAPPPPPPPPPAARRAPSASEPALSAPDRQASAARNESLQKIAPQSAAAQQPLKSAEPRSKVESNASASRLSDDRPGGEGGAAGITAVDSMSSGPRLEISALDDAGAAPALVSGSDTNLDLPEELRGSEFTLVIEAGGRVRDVRPSRDAAATDRETGKKKSLTAQMKDAQTRGIAALASLQFQPGDGPRVLKVRIR